MARARAGQAAAEAFGKVGTVTVPRDANGTEAAADTPAAPAVPQGPAQRRAAGKPAPTPPPGAVPALSKALLQRHIFALDAAFGKARAALNDYEGAMEQVVLVVADARRDEVDEDTIDSAAKRKHIQIPGES